MGEGDLGFDFVERSPAVLARLAGSAPPEARGITAFRTEWCPEFSLSVPAVHHHLSLKRSIVSLSLRTGQHAISK